MSPATGPPPADDGMVFRLYGLEGQVKTQDAAIGDLTRTTARHSEAISAQSVTLARHEEQLLGGRNEIGEVKTDVAALAVAVGQLAEKVATVGNRVAWTLTGGTLAVLGALVAEKIIG